MRLPDADLPGHLQGNTLERDTETHMHTHWHAAHRRGFMCITAVSDDERGRPWNRAKWLAGKERLTAFCLEGLCTVGLEDGETDVVFREKDDEHCLPCRQRRVSPGSCRLLKFLSWLGESASEMGWAEARIAGCGIPRRRATFGESGEDL
mmetsp:Transcript_55988/g.99692  ORF Transcript_55988/g.99692 Transcript_55988/m.99692 type:complete len:150 (-) Transcript_55988:499-948(-)